MGNLQINKKIIIIFKLATDAFVFLLSFFVLVFLGEGAAPGLISAHISFTITLAALLILAGLIFYLANKFNFQNPTDAKKENIFSQKLMPALLFVSLLLIIRSLWKLPWWENAVTSIATIFIFYYFYKLFFLEKD